MKHLYVDLYPQVITEWLDKYEIVDNHMLTQDVSSFKNRCSSIVKYLRCDIAS